jgi:hypothetical protein
MPAAPDDPLTTLAAAADGLLVPSEHDYPLELFRWDGCAPLTPASLVAALGLPPHTPVETRDLATFFAPLTRTADETDAAAQATAARFAALRTQIAAALTDVVVYRVGRIQITAIIAGTTAEGATGGLRTTLIET